MGSSLLSVVNNRFRRKIPGRKTYEDEISEEERFANCITPEGLSDAVYGDEELVKGVDCNGFNVVMKVWVSLFRVNHEQDIAEVSDEASAGIWALSSQLKSLGEECHECHDVL